MKKILFVFCLFILPVSYSSAQNLDIDLLRKINTQQANQPPFWREVSNSAYWVPPAYMISNFAYGIAANDRYALHYGLESAISAGISLAITGSIKELVNRPRPSQTYPDLIHSYSFTNGKSFPSGHTTLAFATATTMFYQSKQWFVSVPIIVWPISVGYSRMRIGKHYPSDVLVGALIGIGSGILSHWVTNQILPIKQ